MPTGGGWCSEQAGSFHLTVSVLQVLTGTHSVTPWGDRSVGSVKWCQGRQFSKSEPRRTVASRRPWSFSGNLPLAPQRKSFSFSPPHSQVWVSVLVLRPGFVSTFSLDVQLACLWNTMIIWIWNVIGLGWLSKACLACLTPWHSGSRGHGISPFFYVPCWIKPEACRWLCVKCLMCVWVGSSLGFNISKYWNRNFFFTVYPHVLLLKHW